jgi:hypothetical protein
VGYDSSFCTEFDHVTCMNYARPQKGHYTGVNTLTTSIITSTSSRIFLGTLLLLALQSALIIGLLSTVLSATKLNVSFFSLLPTGS